MVNDFFGPKPILISHRGANLLALENTLPAFELAYQMGATWAECDVVLTADRVPVILHDRSLWRTAQQRKNIDEVNYVTLDNIPTLESLLELAVHYQRGLNVEIKPALPQYAMMTAEISYQIMAPYLSRIPLLVSSFDMNALAWYQQHAPEVKKGYLLSRWQRNWQQSARAIQAVSIHCNEKILTEKRIAAIKAQNYTLLTYTVNDIKRAQQLLAMGVDGIFSDNPNLLS